MDPDALERQAAQIRADQDAAYREAEEYWASAARKKAEGDRLTAEAQRWYTDASSDESWARAKESEAGQRVGTGFLGF